VTEQNVIEEAEVYNCMKIGNENRSIGFTDMNAQSSRSHSVFILTVYSENSITFVKKTGKLYLVDLAGSEKIAKTGAAG
jgi:kinesin family member 5